MSNCNKRTAAIRSARIATALRVLFFSAALAFAVSPALIGCDDGADEAVEEAGDAVEEAGDEVDDALDDVVEGD